MLPSVTCEADEQKNFDSLEEGKRFCVKVSAYCTGLDYYLWTDLKGNKSCLCKAEVSSS